MSMFIKFDGVDGESMQKDYEGWIEITKCNMASSAPPSTDLGSGSGVGKPTIHGFSFETVAGRHTPQLNMKYYMGEHFPTVTVVFLKQGGASSADKYYELKMERVFISSMTNAKEEGSLGKEAITLSAETFRQEYFSQGGDGLLASVGATTYNNKTNEST
ncbi:MAG: type VI secretion system tube protein Hcp [Pyrinomonadaceae bacterium]